MPLSSFVNQAMLALALGALIGFERQWHRRLIDLKTSALVCLGAALFMMTLTGPAGLSETARMAAQIVVGVGFIGGGLLYREGTHTRGINTAATLWCGAAIGVFCGIGRPVEAVVATALLVAANTVLREAARRLQLRMGLNDSMTEQVCFEFECVPSQASALRLGLQAELQRRHGELRSVSETRANDGITLVSVVAAFESPDVRHDIDAVLAAAQAWNTLSRSWRRL